MTTITHKDQVDVTQHDGSSIGLSLAGVLLAAGADELNLQANDEVQAMTADGEITIKHGMVTLNKGSALLATLPDPVVDEDDFKRLSIVALTAQAHTVTPESAFGNGGTGEAQATYSGVIGDCLQLEAYQGFWYIIGKHQVVIAAVP